MYERLYLSYDLSDTSSLPMGDITAYRMLKFIRPPVINIHMRWCIAYLNIFSRVFIRFSCEMMLPYIVMYAEGIWEPSVKTIQLRYFRFPLSTEFWR